jgi:hypothetical protein
MELLGLPQEERYVFGDEEIVICRDLKGINKFLATCSDDEAQNTLRFFSAQYPTKTLSLS